MACRELDEYANDAEVDFSSSVLRHMKSLLPNLEDLQLRLCAEIKKDCKRLKGSEDLVEVRCSCLIGFNVEF